MTAEEIRRLAVRLDRVFDLFDAATAEYLMRPDVPPGLKADLHQTNWCLGNLVARLANQRGGLGDVGRKAS